MRTIIINKFAENLLRQTEENHNFVNLEYKEEVECVMEILSISWSCYEKAFNIIKYDHHDTQDVCSVLLIGNAISDLAAAFVSLSHGFIRGPRMLLRSALESVAVAVSINTNENYFQQYLKLELKSSKMIGPASVFFPEIGKWYGSYSKNFVHENYMHLGRTLDIESDDLRSHIIKRLRNETENITAICMLNISHFGRIAGKALEYCLVDRFVQLHYWMRIGPFLAAKRNNDEDIKLQQVVSKLSIEDAPPQTIEQIMGIVNAIHVALLDIDVETVIPELSDFKNYPHQCCDVTSLLLRNVINSRFEGNVKISTMFFANIHNPNQHHVSLLLEVAGIKWICDATCSQYGLVPQREIFIFEEKLEIGQIYLESFRKSGFDAKIDVEFDERDERKAEFLFYTINLDSLLVKY